ncbi:MAG: Mut7-C RNAse domain-containing protein [bacterium]
MNSIYIRFYGQLNDFISLGKGRKEKGEGMSLKPQLCQFLQLTVSRRSIKDLIESLGVPHCEVYHILVNGNSVNFNYIVQADDYISVYPKFNSIDVNDLIALQPALAQEIKFILDVHLGKLTKYLRLFGFDSAYKNNCTDLDLIEYSINEKRILLTRDAGLLKNNKVIQGYWLRNTDPLKQIEEIIEQFNLKNSLKPFSRCMICNGEIVPVNKESIIKKLEPKTIQFYTDFFICCKCEKIYWKGSHWKKMENMIKKYVL